MVQRVVELLVEAGLKVRADEPMSLHTHYQIGGPADVFVEAGTRDELMRAVRIARGEGVPVWVFGGGTNVLVADKGIRGVVVQYAARRFVFQEVEGELLVWAEGGSWMREIAREAVRRGWEGLEWAVDLPGTVGGAVVGNAGAFGMYMEDVFRAATVFDADGESRVWEAEEMGFRYRGSRLKDLPPSERPVVVDVTLALRPGDPAELAARAEEYHRRREERQPTEPSAGSVFKRTEKYPAGFLIDQAGLKGVRRGGAMISPKHANFIVNVGGARAEDVRELIELAQREVYARFGEELELEIELIGAWEEES